MTIKLQDLLSLLVTIPKLKEKSQISILDKTSLLAPDNRA